MTCGRVDRSIDLYILLYRSMRRSLEVESKSLDRILESLGLSGVEIVSRTQSNERLH
jgi:hypothetical protein